MLTLEAYINYFKVLINNFHENLISTTNDIESILINFSQTFEANDKLKKVNNLFYNL